MDPEKRKFILLALIVASAVVVGLIIYFMVFYSYGTQPKTVSPVVETPPEVPKITNFQPGNVKKPSATSTAATTPAVDLTQEDVAQVARIFAERYGTYSNQGGADQFEDLNLFVSKKMKDWLATNTKELLAGLKGYETAYVVESRVITAKIAAMDKNAGTASVIVNIRRSEQTGNDNPKLSDKTMKVDLVRAGKRWQVDAAAWQ